MEDTFKEISISPVEIKCICCHGTRMVHNHLVNSINFRQFQNIEIECYFCNGRGIILLFNSDSIKQARETLKVIKEQKRKWAILNYNYEKQKTI